jgi:hypothetical protein
MTEAGVGTLTMNCPNIERPSKNVGSAAANTLGAPS